MPLPIRNIGNHDVSAIGLGLMDLSHPYGTVESELNDEERFKVLDAAVEEGCTFWDATGLGGDNEELVIKWFNRTGKRDQIFLATEFGLVFGTSSRVIDGRPERIRSMVPDDSIGIIDLYYLHRPDPKVPIETTVSAMAELVKEGKVRYLGLCEVSADTLRRAHAVHPIAAVQVEYSPFCLEIESEKIGLIKACQELDIAIVAFSPLGRGMLTGAYKSHDDIPEGDRRRLYPRFGRKNFPNILKLVDDIQEVATRHDITPGQVSLAWILAQGNNIIPIPGSKKIEHLKENLGAAKVKLSEEEVAEVREKAEKASATLAPRYPRYWMPLSFADTPSL